MEKLWRKNKNPSKKDNPEKDSETLFKEERSEDYPNNPQSKEYKNIKRVYLTSQTKPKAVVVYCSDPRFQTAFRDFICEELKLSEGEFIPLVVAGGADALSNPLTLPKEFKFMKDRLKLYQERFKEIESIILIGHEDCKYYNSVKDRIKNFINSKLTLSEQHKTTLNLLPKLIADFITSKVKLEIYFAKFTDETQSGVVFEKLV
ncbi:MAG: hypothetical protein ACP5OG_02315 [Candidatus Nanoarchaeia archaeon]